MEFIEIQKVSYPQLADDFELLGDLYSRKLWHQLSIKIEELIKSSKFSTNEAIVELYTQFITKFEAKLSQVKLSQIASIVGKSFHDPAEAVAFFQTVLVNRTRLGPEAAMCVDMDIVLAKIKIGLTDEARILLEEAKEALSKINSTETVVFSKFYGATTEYRKYVGPPQEFYKSALLFLAYTPVEELPTDEAYMLATDVALAAATGENIFNFGEVLATPILAVLKGTPNEWLYNLILVMNHGDINKFNAIIDQYKDRYYSQPALASRHDEVKKKIVLLCLMNIVFERSPHDRSIKFTDIALRTQLPLNEVEWVLMRAMSLGLMKGTMDEVEGVVEATWVQPRVLDMEQMRLLCGQLGVWAERVKQTLVTVEDQTPELYV